MTYSSTALPRLALAIRLTEQATELLADFANAHADDIERFKSKWHKKTGEVWYSWTGREIGGKPDFLKVQQVVRELWEGKHRGDEDQIIAQGLSLVVPRQEEGYVDTSQLLFNVSWELGCLWASPRDLGDYVWLGLLQHSKQLAVCANKDDECPAPYFIKKKPNQKFCSEACALPAQREFKRQWFREHGEEWRKQWLSKRKRRSTKKRRG
jgi:hypothetical protein